MNPFIDAIVVAGGESYSSVWIDRLGNWMEKCKLVVYGDIDGEVTFEESDLTDVTPTSIKLVDTEALTARTLLTSNELTFSKRFYKITIKNSGTEAGSVLVKLIKTA